MGELLILVIAFLKYDESSPEESETDSLGFDKKLW